MTYPTTKPSHVLTSFINGVHEAGKKKENEGKMKIELSQHNGLTFTYYEDANTDIRGFAQTRYNAMGLIGRYYVLVNGSLVWEVNS